MPVAEYNVWKKIVALKPLDDVEFFLSRNQIPNETVRAYFYGTDGSTVYLSSSRRNAEFSPDISIEINRIRDFTVRGVAFAGGFG